MRMPRLIALLCGALMAPLTALHAQAADPHLIPRPRELAPGAYVTIPRMVTIAVGQSADANIRRAENFFPHHRAELRIVRNLNAIAACTGRFRKAQPDHHPLLETRKA